MATPNSEQRSVVRAPPTSRLFTQWNVDDLEIAEALTNGGQLQRCADLCWALLGDGRVRAALETRVKGLLRLPLSWEEPGKKRKPSPGKKQRVPAIVRSLEGGDFYTAHSEAAMCSLGVWGVLAGIGLAQRVWQMRDGRWIGVLQPYDLRNLRWDPHRRVWVVRTDTGDQDIVLGDRRWVLYAPSCSGMPTGDERPWMYGAWRACARPWLGKHFSWSDWQRHAEMHGSPIRTAEVSEERPPTQKVRDETAESLASIGSDTAFVPAPGLKIKLLEAVGGTWEMFPGAIDAAAREIVIAVTGQSSSTEITQRQQTGANLHQQVRQDLIDADARTLSTCLREQCLVDYAELNYGSRNIAPWPRWETDPPKDIAAKGDAMKKLGDGFLALDPYAPEGMRIDRAAVFEDAGILLEEIPEGAAPVTDPNAKPADETNEDGTSPDNG